MPVFVSSRPRAFLLINEEMLLRATGLSHSSMCELAAAVLELLNTNTYQRDMRIIVMQIILLLLLHQNIAKYCMQRSNSLEILYFMEFKFEHTCREITHEFC